MMDLRRSLACLAASLVTALAGCGEQHVVGAGAIESLCGPFSAGPDLALCSAGYFPAPPTAPGAVDVARDLSLVLAARHEDGEQGAVFRLTPDGRRLLSALVLGAEIDDLEVAPASGHIAVVGRPFGVALLSPDAARVIWKTAVTGQRVGVGDDDTVAVLDRGGHEVRVLGANGVPLARFAPASLGYDSADVAVHGASRTVIVTGGMPAAGSTTGRPLQPVLDGHGYDGVRKWRGYGWDLASLMAKQLTASTSGVRVSIGRDGWLYYLGESHGGNTSHSRDPGDIEKDAPGSGVDAYDTPFNTSQFVTFVARLEAATGRLVGGKLLLARAPGSAPAAGAATHAAAVAADERGHVLVAGRHACCMPGLANRTVAGQPLASSEEDAFVVLLAPDLRSRLLWTTFSRGAPSRASAVALAGGMAAFVAFQDGQARAQAPLVTKQPWLMPAAGPAGYLSVWSAP